MNKKNISIYAITFIILFLIEFGLLSYLSKILSKENYLFYINTINTLPFFTSLIGFGTPFAIIFLASLQPKKSYKYLTESNTLALKTIFIILLASSPLVYINILPNYIPISAILGFFLVVKQNSVSYFLAGKRLSEASYVRLNQKVIFSLILVVFTQLFLLETVWELSVGLLFGEAVGLFLLQQKYKVINLKKSTKIKSIKKISKYHFLAALVASFSIATPVFILNLLEIDIRKIASFAIALQVLKYFTMILAPFMQLITPFITPLKNDQKKVRALYFKFLNFISLLGISSGLVLFYSSDLIANYFFSNEYVDIASFLKIFSWCIPFIMTSSYSSTMLASIGGIKNVLSINIIMLLCMVIISTSLIQVRVETYAVLISVYYVIHFFVIQYFLQKKLKIINPYNE